MESLYWEEISEAWRDRMALLRRRDELTKKNERLVTALKNGQRQLDEVRLQNRDTRRDVGVIRKEIDEEKQRDIEEKKYNEKRETELKRTQGQLQNLTNRLQKKKDEISLEERNTAKLLGMIEQVKQSYQGTNSQLRDIVLSQDSLDDETRQQIEVFISSKLGSEQTWTRSLPLIRGRLQNWPGIRESDSRLASRTLKIAIGMTAYLKEWMWIPRPAPCLKSLNFSGLTLRSRV